MLMSDHQESQFFGKTLRVIQLMVVGTFEEESKFMFVCPLLFADFSFFFLVFAGILAHAHARSTKYWRNSTIVTKLIPIHNPICPPATRWHFTTYDD